MATVLIVDDEVSMRDFLQVFLTREGHDARFAEGVEEAKLCLAEDAFDLVLTDLRLLDGTGLDVLAATRSNNPETQVIVLTAFATAETAVQAMEEGAYDYAIKPVKVSELRALIHKAFEKRELLRSKRTLTHRLQQRYGFVRAMTQSASMQAVLAWIDKASATQATVLLQGESGTGKELLARAIHEQSPRFSGPFVAINCGAIPESLIEAELFGHAKGAFTGASTERAGLFEQARGGTLLLDEVGELPALVQVKLLRVLQERQVRRVGDEQERPVDARIVAATNRDLATEVSAGNFREDLYYRLNVVCIQIPPLRERREDIPILARIFLIQHSVAGNYAANEGISPQFSPAALEALCRYPFPGNVRELENAIERALALGGGAWIDACDLPPEIACLAKSNSKDAAPSSVMGSGVASPHMGIPPIVLPEAGIDLERFLAGVEVSLIQQALLRSGGNKTQAARILGLTFRALRYRLKKQGEAEASTEIGEEVDGVSMGECDPSGE